MSKYVATTYKFDLWGNIQDGFDCNDQWDIDELHSDDLAFLQDAMEYRARENFSKTLPLDGTGNEEFIAAGDDLEFQWSDEQYADIVSKEHGVIVGSIQIAEIMHVDRNKTPELFY